MRPRRAGMPPKGPTGDPVEIDTYLQYARENIARSRMLLKKGDLRYAVFSANEGLELLVKAHMLRYKIIDRAKAAKHFPYPAAIEAMIKITKSNIEKNPPNKKQLDEALDFLSVLKEAFNMVKEKKLEVPMWKSSLNIRRTDDERARVDEFWKKVYEWSKKTAQIQGRQQHPGKQASDKLASDKQARFFEKVLKVYEEETRGCKDNLLPPLPGNKKMPYSGDLEMRQIFALAELIVFINVIVHSSVHQQISRYPTQIDGVDSRETYIDHRSDVEKLLKQIYLASDILFKQLKCGAPFITQSIAAMGISMEELMQP